MKQHNTLSISQLKQVQSLVKLFTNL